MRKAIEKYEIKNKWRVVGRQRAKVRKSKAVNGYRITSIQPAAKWSIAESSSCVSSIRGTAHRGPLRNYPEPEPEPAPSHPPSDPESPPDQPSLGIPPIASSMACSSADHMQSPDIWWSPRSLYDCTGTNNLWMNSWMSKQSEVRYLLYKTRIGNVSLWGAGGVVGPRSLDPKDRTRKI